MSRKIARLFAWCAIAFCASMAAGEGVDDKYGFPIITSYSADQIGSDAAAYCTLQDANGTLYFGGNSLLAFDGERWSSTTTPGLRSIYALDTSDDGRIWAGAEGDLGWYEQSSGRYWSFHSLRSRLSDVDKPRGQVFQVFRDGAGAVFISTDRVYRWDGSAFQVWAFPGVRRITGFRIDGAIYIHYRRTGLYRLDRSGPKLVVSQSLIGDQERGAIIWIDSQPDRWLLATGGGLVELQLQNGASAPFAPTVSKILYDGAVTAGVRLPDGRYGFGTLHRGAVLMKSDGTLDRVLDEQDGFPVSYVTSLFVDRDGSLWITSPSRILRLHSSASTRVFDERANITPETYRMVGKANDELTLANSVGVFGLDKDGRHFSRIGPFSGGIHDIVSTPGGLVVCGFRGAWRVENRRVVPIRSAGRDVQTALPSRVVRNETLLAEYSDPCVVAISSTGASRVVVEKLPAVATSLAEDADGQLWMGTDARGVWVAARTSSMPVAAARVPTEYRLPQVDGPMRVRNSPSGDILAIGSNGGWFKPVASKVFAPVTNHPARDVAAVSNFASSGATWIVHPSTASASATVARISTDQSGARWEPHSIVGLETIGSPRSIFAEKDARGRTVLWIGGTKAVLRHVVETGPSAPKPRPPLLRAYTRTKSDEALQPISSLLPYSTGAIEFEFAEPEYARRAQLRLQTKIDEIDVDWVPAGKDSRRELTAIRDGHYTFRVRAIAETGVASDPTIFTFQVAPPWWRTVPALLLGFAALVPLVYTGYRLRVRSLRRRNALLEEKVRQRTEELAEASAAKTMFVANMSHDIRNPLNGIVGLALALEDTRLDPKQREIVATLRECTTYLSSLVDDVLDFASIEAGRIELRPGPFVPSELLNSVVTTLKAQTAERGSFITIETDPEVPPMLRGDAGRIQQILVNYVSNALKYAGGHIRLAAAVAPQAPGEVEFSVADEGPGISETEQATLFTKFSRLASARRDQIKGTGLGLAACRLLADIMGGSVGVESHVGRGSRFHLRLPLAVASEPPPVPADVSLPRTSVLLVEDTDYNAMAATAVLSRLGLVCDRAKNGEEAVQLFTAKRHNIVLLDRNLPDMDGTTVARRMRELENDGLRAVILAVTAYCTEDDRNICLDAGMDAFVGKPLTPEKLRRVLIDAGRRLLATASVDAPVASPPTQSPELDTTLLKYLSDGTEGGIAAQAERFIAALDEAHRHVISLHAAGDIGALGDAAHRVLGHARMVGAAALAEAASEIEVAARKSDASRVAKAMPAMAREVVALTAILRRPHREQRV